MINNDYLLLTNSLIITLGGPSRYFAGKLGAEVTAVELQDDLSRAAKDITEVSAFFLSFFLFFLIS